MPQMAPMSWLILMIITLFSLLLSASIIYFTFEIKTYNLVKNFSLTKTYKLLSW